MNLVTLHSPHERCGIAEYGRQLDEALRQAGAGLYPLTFQATKEEILSRATAGTTVLVHFEPALVTPATHLAETLAAAREQGAKVVFCCHWFEPGAVLGRWANLAHQFVLHRPYPGIEHNEKITTIPLGCPVYEPSETRGALRKKYGLPEHAVIVTTAGFLSPWKRLPQVTASLFQHWPHGSNIYFQLLGAIPYHGDAAQQEMGMRRLLRSAPRAPVYFSTDFLSDKELLDRLHISDLGFLFHGQDTGSVSAATKAFVSARCPLVVTGSSHASDIEAGVHRIQGFDVGHFARQVLEVAASPARREDLQAGMRREYGRLSMTHVAERYLDLFRSL